MTPAGDSKSAWWHEHLRHLRDDRRRLQVRLARAMGGLGWGRAGLGSMMATIAMTRWPRFCLGLRNGTDPPASTKRHAGASSKSAWRRARAVGGLGWGRAGLVLGSMMATMAMMAMGAGRQQCSSEQAAGAGGCVV